MKNTLVLIFSLFFVFISSLSFAGKSIETPEKYKVVKSELNTQIPQGMCLLKGFVTSPEGGLAQAEISTLDRDYRTFTDSSGYYEVLVPSSDTSIFMYKENVEEIVIWSIHFEDQHEITLYFLLGPQLIQSVDKPVIYLYNTKPVEASVNLDFKGEMTFTYPVYNNEWNVTVTEDQIKDLNTGQTFPYLFWEGEMKGLKLSDNKGFIIATDTCVTFFEATLTEMGFNWKERTDFITFWGPKLQHKKFARIQFILDETYANQIANITVNPTPDSMMRMFMLFTLYDNCPEIELEKQVFTPFNRTGFSLIEWGGSEIQNNQPDL